MKNSIKISIIIPVFNTEKELMKCIESVISQSYKNIEIILVDDGSTDESGNICDSYLKKDNRIKVYHQENKGASSARNVGLINSTGEYIMFLDSDDFWIDNYCLEDAIKKLQSFNKKIDVMFLKVAVIKKDGSITKSKGYEFGFLDKTQIMEYISKQNKTAVSACLKILNKKIFDDKELYFQDNLLAEDIDWFFKLIIKAENYVTYNKDFYCYRIRKNSASRSVDEKRIKDYIYILEKWINIVKENNYSMKEKRYFYSMIAYEYEILISTLYNYNKKITSDYIFKLSQLFWLLKYRNQKRSYLIRGVKKIIGFKNTCKLLNFYLNNRKINR